MLLCIGCKGEDDPITEEKMTLRLQRQGGRRVLLIYHCQGMLFLFLGMSHLVSMLASK